ncbi:MAG: MBL fold metallo-hydrolase [Clostridia bacterium]|nr:MBL fold metallo-hydrolase [Clostridia bacterium]
MTEFYLLGNTTEYQMFGALILTEHHALIVDGGLMEDASALYELLCQKGINKIDAWFFTHPHHDHLGAFMAFCRDRRDVTVERLYLNFPHRETLRECPAHKAHGGVERQMWEEIWDLLEGPFRQRFTTIQRGDTFFFDELTLNVLRVYNPAFDRKRNFVNNSSAVFRLDTPSHRLLLLGDLGVEGGEELMRLATPEELDADYTQMAHHGQKGVTRACYEYLRPRRCIWPTPATIWNNIGADGPGSGKWDTLETRSWMEELGVGEHIIAKDGTFKLLL